MCQNLIALLCIDLLDQNTRGGGGGGPPRQSQDPIFKEVTLNESKQSEDQCLGITQGNIIELPPRQQFDDSRPPKPFRDVIDYTHIVQSFRVIYLDAQSLVDKGFVKLSCHNHICYLNEEFFSGNESAMIQVLQTLIESGQRDKEIQDIQQTINVIVERFDYYFTGELLNIFMSTESQEQMQLDPAQRTEFLCQQLSLLMESWSEFFHAIGDGTFKITQKYDQKIFLHKIQEREQQQQQQQQQQQL